VAEKQVSGEVGRRLLYRDFQGTHRTARLACFTPTRATTACAGDSGFGVFFRSRVGEWRNWMEEQDPKTGESPLRLLLQEVGELRREIKEQEERLTKLEMALSKVAKETADMAATVEAAASEAEDEVTPELMAVIAAAVTAFLGKKVKIHQARLVNPEVVSPWAQQGRVFVQASHALARY
jgi:methylmalonyl-CoA carboxyltransferase large subunit